MKVFLGWSGERSRELARALHEWLPLVLHYVDPWMSQNDIAAGERWSQELASHLEASNFGIISVTQDNIQEPWILFEAGSLAKSMHEGRVTPFLLDLEISDVSGPLAQFQSKKASKSGTWDIVCAVNKCAQAPVQDSRIKQLFNMAWPELQQKVASIPVATNSKPLRTQHEVLEELVTSVRSFDSRLSRMEEKVDEGRTSHPRNRRRLFHLMMIQDVQQMMGKGPADPVGLLAVAGLFRDEFPPLYELCMEAYRAVSAGKAGEARLALERLQRMSEMVLCDHMSENLGMPGEMHVISLELQSMIDHLICELRENIKPPRSTQRKPTG
ncbi:MAG: TIR domain-containing protein [Fimbriimonadaceae bacterium]